MSVDLLKNLKRLVGRDEYIQKMRELYEEVLQKRGKCVLIEGEAGIGKTTLVEYFVKGLDAYYIRVQGLVYRSVEPYLPFLEVIPRLRDDEMSSESLFAVPISRDVDSTLFFPTSSDYAEKDELEIRTSQIPEKIRKKIVDMSERKPVIIFVDDIQWMDEGSLTVFLYILRSLENKRIFLIGAYRPEDLILEEGEHMFVDILRRIESNPLVQILKLRRLNFNEVKTLLTEIVGYNIPNDVIKIIYEQTDGNPYFINELLKDLIEKGLIDPNIKMWNPMITPEDILIPKTLESLTLRKYDLLSEVAKKFVRVAAVYGREFKGDEIIEIAGLKEEEGIEAIEQLLKYDFIVEMRDGYSFKYLQMQRAIYNRMSKIHRNVLHKKIAEYIEARSRDVFMLARHYYLGGVKDKASTYLLEAARYAQKMGAFRTSLWFLNSLLNLGVENDEIYYMLVLAYHILGEPKNIPKYAEKISEESVYYPTAMIFFAEYYMDLSEHRKAYNLLEGLVEKLSGDNKALVLAKMAFIAPYINRIKLGEKLIEEALKIASGDYTRAVIMKTKGVLAYHKVEIEEMVKYLEAAKEILESSEKYYNHPELVRVLMDLAIAYENNYMHEKAIEYYEKSKKLAEEIGYVKIIPTIIHNISTLYSKMGEYQKALNYLKESMEMCKVIEDNSLYALAKYNYAALLSDIGEYEETIKNLMEALELARENSIIEVLIKFLLGYTHILIGNSEVGMKLVEEAIQKEENESFKKYNRAWILLIKGEIEDCRKIFDELISDINTPKNIRDSAIGYLCDIYAWKGDKENLRKYIAIYRDTNIKAFYYTNRIAIYEALLNERFEEAYDILHRYYEKNLKNYVLYAAIPVIMYMRSIGRNDTEFEEWCRTIANEINDVNALALLS